MATRVVLLIYLEPRYTPDLYRPMITRETQRSDLRYHCALTMFTILMTCCTPRHLHAQAIPLTPAELVSWEADKRYFIYHLMRITQAEAAQFWNDYELYEHTRRSLCRTRLKLIRRWMRNRRTLTLKQEHALAKKILRNNLDYSKLYRAYYKRMKVVIAPERAFRFIEYEKSLQQALNADIDSCLFDRHDDTRVFSREYQ